MNAPVTPAKYQSGDILQGINWNETPDDIDQKIWHRLTSNFWLPEAIALSNDRPGWANMNDAEQSATMRVFTGLTLLDTIQGTVGAVELIKDAETQQEEAVLTNMAFMESVHARSYSTIFMTLAGTPEINDAFRWSRENKHLQYKAQTIMDFYKGEDPIFKKIASVFLESFLFYAGFYLPLRFAASSKLSNTADIIRLIIRDEAVHGYFIGWKAQKAIQRLAPDERNAIQEKTIDLLMDLYDNECRYTEDIYDDLGWSEDVKAFLRYQGNKALMNLGFEGLFPQDDCKFHPGVMTSLDPGSLENHDFFSGSGSSYVIGTPEATEDGDWVW